MPLLTQVIGIIMAAVTMCAVLCNALVLIVICWNRSLKRPLNVFLFNLAIADIGISCTCIPYAIGQIFFKNKAGTSSTFCNLSSFLVTVFMTASILVITSLSLYQYLMVTGPLETDVSGLQNATFLALAWTMAVGLAIGPMFHWGKYELSTSIFGCYYKDIGQIQYLSYNSTLAFIIYVFPFILLVFCYSSILFAIRDSDTRIAKGWIVASIATEDSCIETGQRRIIIVAIMTISSFILFRTPSFITLLLKTLKIDEKWLLLADQIAFWALYFHAALDPFVYAFQHGEYCKTLREIAGTMKRSCVVCCCCHRIEEGERRKPKRVSSLEKIEEE